MEELLGCLQSGIVRPDADVREQRFLLSEAAFEVVERQGPRPLLALLRRNDLPSASIGAVIEASVPALQSNEEGRELLRGFLGHRDDYVVAAALRVLAALPEETSLEKHARSLWTHQSPLVRAAALEALINSAANDLEPLLHAAFRDPAHEVRMAALNLADDLAAREALDPAQSRRFLSEAKEDPDFEVRRFAESLTALDERAESRSA